MQPASKSEAALANYANPSMGASFDITDNNPTHICPKPVFPTKPKAILTIAI